MWGLGSSRMWHGVFGLMSPSILGECSFICRKSIKNGSSGSYSWTSWSLKTRHQVALEHQQPLTWWRSITFQKTSNLIYYILQLYSTKPAGEITSSHSMKFQVHSHHLTCQSTIIHPAMSQECTTYISCYVLMLLHILGECDLINFAYLEHSVIHLMYIGPCTIVIVEE